jgi:LysM repeat protein
MNMNALTTEKAHKPFRKIEITVYLLAICAFSLLLYLFINRSQTSLIVKEDNNKVKDTILAYNDNASKSSQEDKDLSTIFNNNDTNDNANIQDLQNPNYPVHDSINQNSTSIPAKDGSDLNSEAPLKPQNDPNSQLNIDSSTLNPKVASPIQSDNKIPQDSKQEVPSVNNDNSSSTPMSVVGETSNVQENIPSSNVTESTPIVKPAIHKTVRHRISHRRHYRKVRYSSKTAINPKSYNKTVLARYKDKASKHLFKVKSYKIKSGDSIWSIAHKHRVSAINLIAANPQLDDPDMLHAGQALNIPNR